LLRRYAHSNKTTQKLYKAVHTLFQHKQDWLMRQIQMLIEFIARITLNKASITHEMDEQQMGETGELYMQLKELLADGSICAAEDALTDIFNKDDDHLRLAMWFYSEINNLTDEELEASNFSRQEIYEGLQEVLSRNGISLLSLEGL